jgi:DNA replication protein DnaC
MAMEPHLPPATASDTPPTPTEAAACSDNDLCGIVYRAMQSSPGGVDYDLARGQALTGDELVANALHSLRCAGYRPEPPERILAAAEHVRQKVAEARARNRLAAFREAIGKRYADCTLDNFETTLPEQEQVLAKLRDYVSDIRANVDLCRGLVLFGPAGTGKDHLLVGAAKVAICAGVYVEWKNGRDLCGQFRDAIKGESIRSEGGLLRDLEAPDVLILSDPVPPTGRLTESQGDVLFRLVDARYRAMKATWATLNVSGGNEADSRLGSQIVDRLRHDALALFCDWPSYRTAR